MPSAASLGFWQNTRFGAVAACPVERCRVGVERRGRADAEREVQARGRVYPRCCHVVRGIADPGHHAPADRSPVFLEGHDVGENLARVRAVGQAVDDRHGGVFGQLHQRLMRRGAQHQHIDIARQHARGVGDGLAAAELHVVAVQYDGITAELAHGHIEGNARARRRFLEHHRQQFAGRNLSIAGIASSQVGLHRMRMLEKRFQRRRVECVDIEKVPW